MENTLVLCLKKVCLCLIEYIVKHSLGVGVNECNAVTQISEIGSGLGPKYVKKQS